MTIKDQTMLLLIVLLLTITAGILSISHQVYTLSHLEQKYLDTKKQISNLKKEWEILTLERWMLLNLGTYPRNASPLEFVGGVKAFLFYSSDISEENLTSKFDPLMESFNVTIAYLGLINQTNLNKLKDICNKIGFPEPSTQQSYFIVLNSSKIICLSLEQVDNEVFNKCLEYLNLSVSET